MPKLTVDQLKERLDEADSALIESVNEKDEYMEAFRASHAKLQTAHDAALTKYMEARAAERTDEEKALDQEVGV